MQRSRGGAGLQGSRGGAGYAGDLGREVHLSHYLRFAQKKSSSDLADQDISTLMRGNVRSQITLCDSFVL